VDCSVSSMHKLQASRFSEQFRELHLYSNRFIIFLK